MTARKSNNRRLSNRSRKIARERFWDQHEKSEYRCPDCGRFIPGVVGTFEVHHENGDPHDNRIENLVALCRVCHCLREGKKPSLERITRLRDVADSQQYATLAYHDIGFVDRVVCMCAEGWSYDWGDPIGVWLHEYESYCAQIGVEEAQPRMKLLHIFQQMPRASVQWDDDGILIFGPAPNHCDCVSAHQILDSQRGRSE